MKELKVIDLGRMDYASAFKLQESVSEERRTGGVCDTLLFVEHEPVYTMGCSADESNILSSSEQLEASGIQVVQSTRGGDVTYHGPGQVVGYPIIHIGSDRSKIPWYVHSLEQTIIKTLADYGVVGTTDRTNRGVWVGSEKVAAIGVRVSRNVTMHGFALNVEPDMTHFRGIVPCGIANKGVTSMRELGVDVNMYEVKESLLRNFCKVFEYDNYIYKD
jgi:lipoyl(octanoyl) transferase